VCVCVCVCVYKRPTSVDASKPRYRRHETKGSVEKKNPGESCQLFLTA